MRVGVVGRIGGPLGEADARAIKKANVEAIKFEHWDSVVDGLLNVLRPPLNGTAESVTQAAYDAGVRHFILHKHPNARECGWGDSWDTPGEFADNWLYALDCARKKWPETLWGFPAMEPGGLIGTYRADSEDFVRGCAETIAASDFIEIESWWKSKEGMEIALWRIDSLHRLYPDKSVMVTFANTNGLISKVEKARQYVKFYKELTWRNEVIAAFSFCLSSPVYGHQYMTWRTEGGVVKSLPKIIGNR